jgi:hypothetical protein
MTADEKLMNIRPSIKLSNTDSDSEVLIFQNQTLRPILKFNNEKILKLINLHLPKLKNIVTADERRKYVIDYFNKNIAITHLLIGQVSGLMTMDEYETYLQNEAEYHKRIKTMIVERVASQPD